MPRFFGWTVVAAAFVVAVFGWGVGFYGPPIFLKAIHDTRGWPVALVSGAITVHFLMGAVAVANLPRLHRVFGLPAVTFAGAISLAAGIAGWALAATPWQLFAATLFSGAGWVALGPAGINAMVSPWFNRRRPAALSMAYNGASIGGVIFSPLWVALIGWAGFPAATLAVGAVMIGVIAVLALLVIGRTPEPEDESAAATSPRSAQVANPWRDRAFLTLSAGMALGLFAQIGLIAHLFSLLVPALGDRGAGMAAGAATVAAIAGRTLAGWLMPLGADRRTLGALNYGVQIAGGGAFLLAGGTNIPLLLTGVLLFGVGIGNATSIPPLIAQSEFSKQDVARVVALMTAVSQALYAFAPAAFGLIRDASPASGSIVFVTAAAFQAAAAIAYVAGRRAWRARLAAEAGAA